jgi:acyl dehydratase
MVEIRFDDVEALRARIGDEFGAFGETMEVTQELIDGFAELTGDDQWIHVDPERCRQESPFGTTIAHGFLLVSLLTVLTTSIDQGFRVVDAGNVINYGCDGFRFLAPVPAGSRIHARQKLTAVEPAGRGTRVTSDIAVHVVGRERPALVYTAVTLFQPPASG